MKQQTEQNIKKMPIYQQPSMQYPVNIQSSPYMTKQVTPAAINYSVNSYENLNTNLDANTNIYKNTYNNNAYNNYLDVGTNNLGPPEAANYQINNADIIQSNFSENGARNQMQERVINKYINNITNAPININLNPSISLNPSPNTITLNRGNLGVATNTNNLFGLAQEQRNNNTRNGAYLNSRMMDFSNPLHFNPKQTNKLNNAAQQKQHIPIQKTLQKPKFGFKKQQVSQIPSQYTDDDLISFQHSSIADTKRHNQSNMSLNASKSASNFSEVLKIQENKYNVKKIKNGALEGYIIHKFDKKQQFLAKKLQQIKKTNQVYDQKIRQKQRQIQLIKKRTQKQQKQLNNYQQKMIQAYDNVTQDHDSLLLSSRNYETSNKQMQLRVKDKVRVQCNFQGMTKKLCKQIIYGKCLIFQNDLVQIGFDNRNGPGLIQLYFTVKENLIEMQVYFSNFLENGFTFENEPFQMRVNNIPAGKKIKAKTYLKYVGTIKDKVGFISLKVIMKLNINSVFSEQITLPFTLYRNFITQIIQKNAQNQKVLRIKQTSLSPNYKQLNSSNKYQNKQLFKQQNNFKMVTQWQNSCDQFIKNPKSYLDSIFNHKTGRWVQQNVFNIQLLFKDFQRKQINILINCHNFAIEMHDTRNLDVVNTIGNFICKFKENKESKLSRIK